jgi:DNA-binding response OmpR family regulator
MAADNSKAGGVPAKQLDESPVLIGQSGELQGRRWALDRSEVLIGRAPECDVVVPDRQVSRHHARLTRTDGGYIIEDLKSKNGTHVNGAQIDAPVALQDGDVIQVALAMSLMFVGTEATLPLSMDEASQMGLGRLRMDQDAHRAWIRDAELEPPLSPAQYSLLSLLYENMGRVISRSEVVETVWPESDEAGVSEQAIDALVRRLRDRLAEVDPGHDYVVTVRGHGFRLDNPA